MAYQVRRAAWLHPDWWRLRPTAAVTLLCAAAVAAFSSLWTRGSVVLDGRGIALYVRLSASHLSNTGRIAYWLPDMWAGSPVWALGPSLPLFLLIPLTSVVGGNAALKIVILALQVVGGVGAYILARSLWGNRPGAVLAGFVYSLHPLLISHGALLGLEALLAVTAAMPWFAWAFRKALRGDGTRFVVGSGLIAALAVLHQAEYALSLALLCGTMLLVELTRDRHEPDPRAWQGILGRTAAVFGIGLAGAAYWLLPLAAMRDSFVLSPPELVRAELTGGAAAQISNEMGVFFRRPPALTGTVSYLRSGLLSQFFYMGLVCLALTLVTVALLSRDWIRRDRPADQEASRDREGDGYLVGILVACGMALWFSTGRVPLVRSGPAIREQIAPLVVTGLATGLLLGCVLRHVRLGRFRPLGLLAAAALVVAVPFVTPYVTLQKVVPIFAVIRFPRFYALVPLGLALGSAFPAVFLERWLHARGDRRSLLPAAFAAGLAVVFLVDIFPLRGLYQVVPPDATAAYRRASEALPESSRLYRVATGQLEPGAASELIDNGWLLSTGWPHPVAGRQLWRLTGETYPGPPGYREAAFGLSATAFIALEQSTGLGTADEKVTDVAFARNTRALPLLRSYEQVVVADDADLAPLLATGLAYRNVAVVTGRGDVGHLFKDMPTVTLLSPDQCAQPSVADLHALAGEVATACAVDSWLGPLLRGTELVPVDHRPGGIFTAQANGLRGVSVWLDREQGEADLSLFEVGADGAALGPELARAQGVGTDEYGLTAFTFDPIPDSAGRRFAFVLSCARCQGDPPLLVVGSAEGREGDLIESGVLRTERVATQVPIYDRVPPASPPSAAISATGRGPGYWDIEIDAANPTLLVVAEAWFPGWRATVDGKSAPVVQADGAFLGVSVTPGRHVVHMEYRRPLAADLGRAVTGLTLLALAVGWWRRRRAQPDGAGPLEPEDDEWEVAATRTPRPVAATPAPAPRGQDRTGEPRPRRRPVPPAPPPR